MALELSGLIPFYIFRNSLQLSFIIFILVPYSISFGRCDDMSFSICWMSEGGALERQDGNVWLNDTALKSIRAEGKVTSLTVPPAVENKLTLQYGGYVQSWTLRFTPRTKDTEVRGQQKPVEQPTSATKGFLDSMSPNEVFACENGTVFFHQDEDFFLAVGHTKRLPVALESRSPSMLLVSWGENRPAFSSSHMVTLYYIELGSFNALGTDTIINTTNNHYRFTALNACSAYVPCVETGGSHSLICIATITDPDIPHDFAVKSWNSHSLSLAWDCPEKFSFFLLTAFYLNGVDHITEEVLFLVQDNFEFVLSDLEPCTKVKFGLQTVCQAGVESRYSKMVLNDGNSADSSIGALRQTSFGPDNYTISWEVRNTSSISMFRVYHEEVLQGPTLITSATVGGLLPCKQYQAKVEALCGDDVLMSSKVVTAHTGPRGVSELRYRSNDSTALWMPRTHQPAVAFLYELSVENGPTMQSSRVTDPEVHLPGLEKGKTYLLDVWEECGGQWKSERSHLDFETPNSSFGLQIRAAGHVLDEGLQFNLSFLDLTMIVPWSMPADLLDDMSEPRAKMEKIYKDKLHELLKDFSQPVRIELASFEPADDPDKTEVLFMSFDASETERDVPLSVGDLLDYIQSLKTDDVTVTDGVIHWNGPDLCASSKRPLCPRNSLCINTLGSYTCVCQHGYYDVTSIMEPPVASHPVCNEKGLFSQCGPRHQMVAGIAKPYLTSYIGGEVDVRLNDGRCTVNQSDVFYYFRSSLNASECGTQRRVNTTHIVLQNTLTVTMTREHTTTRRDLKVVWKCVYPRHYIRNAQVGVDMEWLTSISLVAFNSSLQLGLTMTLHTDESFTSSYRDVVTMELEDTLFFQVTLQSNNSFAADVLLQVESCWATESTDPHDAVQAILLEHSCAVDYTFRWLSVNGLAQMSRFSIQMFTMPKGLPLYVHCQANICGQVEDCSKNCTNHHRPKRSVSQTGREGKKAAVVSAGPVVVINRKRTTGVPSDWTEHMTMISIVAGSIGFLGGAVLLVSATKAVMSYYERLQLQ
ncbi:uncharacterized protein LOC120817111 isoform X1 [Gasterosteus aculeatus]